jgi:hypothetical protein
MFEPEVRAFLQGGCALIIGTVSPEGEPHAGRAWGLTVVEESEDRALLRVLVDRRDVVLARHVEDRGAVAVTAGDVRSLRSVQLKGRSLGAVGDAAADRARASEYCERFFGDVEEADHHDRAVIENMRPPDYDAFLFEAVEMFDQTPGPRAGARLADRS